MKRKEYLKPEMKVILLKSKTQLLAGSTTFELNNTEVDDEL